MRREIGRVGRDDIVSALHELLDEGPRVWVCRPWVQLASPSDNRVSLSALLDDDFGTIVYHRRGERTEWRRDRTLPPSSRHELRAAGKI